jgi:YggT family protein
MGIGEILMNLILLMQLAILVRVLYSWVDPSPYPTNAFKRVLWAVTDPLLEPIRRVVPPMGQFDVTPIVAFAVLWVLGRVVQAVFFPY